MPKHKPKQQKPSRRKRVAEEDIPCCCLAGGGYKYPDACAERTIVVKCVTSAVHSTDANGRLAQGFAPGKLKEALASGTFTGSDVTLWNETNTSLYGHLNTNAQAFRVVGATVQVDYIHNDLENQGSMALKSDSATTAAWPSLNDNPINFGAFAPVSKYGPLREGAYFVATPNSGAAYDFLAPSTNDTVSTAAWGCHYLFVEGAKANTPVVRTTLTQFLEVRFDSNNFITRLATPPAEDRPEERGIINSAYSRLSALGRDVDFGTLQSGLQSFTRVMHAVSSTHRMLYGQPSDIVRTNLRRMEL